MNSDKASSGAEKCLQCREQFDQRLRQKVFIACGHVYCLKCMSQFSPQDQYYYCKGCAQHIQTTKIFRENLQSFIEKERKLYVTCKLHQGTNATHYCTQCGTYACIYCVKEKHGNHQNNVDILSQDHAEKEVKNKANNIRGLIEQFSGHLNKLSNFENQAHEVDFNEFQNTLKSIPQQQEVNTEKMEPTSYTEEEYAEFFSNITNKVVKDKMKQYPRVKLMHLKSTSTNTKICPIHFYSNGDVYMGERLNGISRRDGIGMQIYSDGSFYSGNWKRSYIDGEGIHIDSQGDVYDGQWIEDVRVGKGTMYYMNGFIYSGQWADDQRHGSGVLTFHDGTKYKGQFTYDQQTGYGRYQWSNGNKYKGWWLNGFMSGMGTWTNAAGNKYEGQFINDLEDGYGVYTWANGSKYEGQWSKGRRHGYGKGTDINGNIEFIKWENEKKVGKITDWEFKQIQKTNR
eukprot:403359714